MIPQLTYYDLSERVVAFSTTRRGGHSQGCYAELNVNEYCGDSPESVRKNRQELCKALGLDVLIIPHQVHGTEVRQITADGLCLSENLRRQMLEGVDAVMTDAKDICIGVSTADCIPVLLYDPEHHCAAAVHAGWRGTVARIVEKTIQRMSAAYGTLAQQLRAVIGPGISLENFEVGQEVYDAFLEAAFPMQRIAAKRPSKDLAAAWKWHLDLPLCNRLQMESAGMLPAHIYDSGICTFERAEEYFSARRMGINSGRIYTGIILR